MTPVALQQLDYWQLEQEEHAPFLEHEQSDDETGEVVCMSEIRLSLQSHVRGDGACAAVVPEVAERVPASAAESVAAFVEV